MRRPSYRRRTTVGCCTYREGVGRSRRFSPCRVGNLSPVSRIAIGAVAGAVAALVLAGCGSTSPSSSATGSGSSSQSQGGNGTPSTAPAPTGSGGSASAGSGSAGAGSQASSSGAAGSDACSSLHLALQIAGSSAAAGTQVTHLLLRNAGTESYTIQGFPGASFLDQDGQPMGSPAQRRGDSGTPVTIKPRQVVNAQLRSSLHDCRTDSPESGSVRVFPPGNTGALTTFLQVPVCGTSTITPIEAGIGDGQTGVTVPPSRTDDPATCSSTHLA